MFGLKTEVKIKRHIILFIVLYKELSVKHMPGLQSKVNMRLAN